jgi:predicted nucleic acid-binding protein
MTERYFLDTNIFLYSILDPKNESEKEKEKISISAIENEEINLIISSQVINELANCLFKKSSLNGQRIIEIIAKILEVVDIIPLTPEITLIAVEIKERYGFSFYDSLIVAAALSAQCDVLLTEDLQHQQIIEYDSNRLKVVNPFEDEYFFDRLHQ